jgi:hypothetical protein
VVGAPGPSAGFGVGTIDGLAVVRVVGITTVGTVETVDGLTGL